MDDDPGCVQHRAESCRLYGQRRRQQDGLHLAGRELTAPRLLLDLPGPVARIDTLIQAASGLPGRPAVPAGRSCAGSGGGDRPGPQPSSYRGSSRPIVGGGGRESNPPGRDARRPPVLKTGGATRHPDASAVNITSVACGGTLGGVNARPQTACRRNLTVALSAPSGSPTTRTAAAAPARFRRASWKRRSRPDRPARARTCWSASSSGDDARRRAGRATASRCWSPPTSSPPWWTTPSLGRIAAANALSDIYAMGGGRWSR